MPAKTSKPTTTRSNAEWLQDLHEPAEPAALEDLRKTLLIGLRATLANKIDGDLDSISEDFAQDAMLKILDSLDTFRGESRFTTWAQKIAIHVAYSELRRRRWKDISLRKLTETEEGDEFTPAILTDNNSSPERDITQQDVMDIVEELINKELTERQREAMLSMLNSDVPMNELAEKLDTNPNALYKMVHDARKRLQVRLEEKAGLTSEEVLALFEEQ